jgi:hypothetical protein
MNSKWNKIGKRALAREVEKFMDLAFKYERGYMIAMSALRELDPNHEIFDSCPEKLLDTLDKSVKIIQEKKSKMIVKPRQLVKPSGGLITKI